MGRRYLPAAGLATLVVLSGSAALQAQHPVERSEWSVEVIRPSGQLVAPVFEGHYQNPDGTHSLVFGYHNLNTDEAVDIPLGPDNFIEPRQYDGMQPTHFDPVPENGTRRHWGVFTVIVREDFRDQNVVWNLRHRGHLWSIPGTLRSPHYLLDAVDTDARDTHAPVMKFEPDGLGWRGRDGMVTGPLSARVGEPLPLSMWVYPDPNPQNLVWWFKHQGPGDVTFSEWESVVEQMGGEATTTATFSEPGEYMLRVKAVENMATIEFHCCWTNGYVRVRVTE